MKNKNTLFLLALVAIVAIFGQEVMAAPWETGLSKLQKSLTGPVASGLALIGIVASGGMLIFGGEISGFLKSAIYLVLVVSIILGANKVISMVNNSHDDSGSGAIITYYTPNTPTTFDITTNTYYVEKA